MQKKELVLLFTYAHIPIVYFLLRERDFFLFRAARMVFAADFLRYLRILDWNSFFE
tara:strand:+ start:320 stop:487 length:168 start_codon:yes stop_codon:yes gene_type:complete